MGGGKQTNGALGNAVGLGETGNPVGIRDGKAVGKFVGFFPKK
jgi:hypothetical protein